MISLGIDQSFTSTGCCVIGDDELLYAVTISSNKSQDFFDRSWYITTEIIKIIQQYNPDCILMEDLAFGSSGNATRALAGLQYLIVVTVRQQLQREIQLVPPTTLKKFATGKGNSKKDEMYNHLPDSIKLKFKELNFKKTKGLSDITDAYFLALINQK